MLSAVTITDNIAPDAHVRSLFQHPGKLPKGVSVFFARRATWNGLSWLASRNWSGWHFPGFDPLAFEALESSSYKISFQLGSLGLLVAYWPEPTWKVVLDPNLHGGIWSDDPDAYHNYPDRYAICVGTVEEHFRFHRMLGAAPKGFSDGEFGDGVASAVLFNR